MAIRANSHGPADAEQQQRAMQDPEIQAIMADPMIRNVLNNFQENPKQAQEDMKDPSVVRTQPFICSDPLLSHGMRICAGREIEQADRSGCAQDRLSAQMTSGPTVNARNSPASTVREQSFNELLYCSCNA